MTVISMEDSRFNWIEFYMELATKLLAYKNRRMELIEKVKNLYDGISLKVPKLESDDKPKDIDPFTVFGLFNKGITNANRVLIAQRMAEKFGVKAAVPTTFDGIPVVNNLKATFYYFKEERGADDIDNLWELFEAAIQYADTGEGWGVLMSAYNKVRLQRGIQWNITMALYWIRPYVYLNLDAKNREYILKNIEFPIKDGMKIHMGLLQMPVGDIYLTIVDAVRTAIQDEKYKYKTFPELSYYAWIDSGKSDLTEKSEKQNKEKHKSNVAHIRWTRPIVQALKDLGGSGTPAEVRARIVINEHLNQEEINVTRGKTKVNKFENEVAFARNDLAVAGYIDKSVRGIWTLTDAGKQVDITDEMASDLFRHSRISATERAHESSGSLADDKIDTVSYGIYSPGHGAQIWEECYKKSVALLGWGEIGNLNVFDSKDEIKQKMKEVYGDTSSYKNSAHATWQFAHDMKPGDVIFVKKGIYEILGRGVVTSEYEYDEERTDEFSNVRHVKWTHKGNWTITHQTPQKSLTDITPYKDFVQQIKELFEDDVLDLDDDITNSYPLYSLDDFLSEVYMDENDYNQIVSVLKKRKNIILQGAPGVGKTFVAKRIAYAMMGMKDIDRVQMVQFHQSYSYEDFVMGFRPTTTGFELRKGVFYNFCKKAEIDSDNEYFFIIDEINRGNLSKIFGELFMLIENDKRGKSIQLLYSEEKFSIPENVYIIGMMNTADRSLALLDYALRRRFSFIDMKPGFKTEGFAEYQSSLDCKKFDKLVDCVERLNRVISEDDTLGEGFCIGHSYFCNLDPDTVTENTLNEIVKYELIPLLKEYWFDEPSNVRKWSDELEGAIR